MKKRATLLTKCRLCESKNLKVVIDLGNSPPPNTLLKKSQLKSKESIFPLKVNYCVSCGQLQLSHVVSPEIMFRHYPYVSSTSKVMVDHFEQYAKSSVKNLKLQKGQLVVEMGSNDGILLKFFKDQKMKVLGVDPARNIAKLATKSGIPTIPDYYTETLAKKLVKKYGYAKLIIGNNVFAHINDVADVARASSVLLEKDGVLIIEFPYVVDLIDNNVFDSIYHEHLSYLSVTPLEKFFNRFEMQIFNVVKSSVQGGSIRIHVKRKIGKYKVLSSVKKFMDLEKKKRLKELATYKKYSKKIESTKKSLMSILLTLKKKDKTIIGYGAPGRSTTLLNYFGINTKILDCIVDDNPHKLGLFTPGTHIPIINSRDLAKLKPDYILILSWNFAKPIMSKLSDLKKKGVKFIIPIPTPKVI